MIGRTSPPGQQPPKISSSTLVKSPHNGSPELLSQHDYAKRRGVSRQYIGKLVSEGILPLNDGKINPVQADAILEARREPARQTHQQHQAVLDGISPLPAQARTVSDAELPKLLLKTRIKSESERAKLLEIKAKVEAGKYVEIDEVRAAAFKQARIVRDHLAILADRIAPILANISDAREIHRIIEEEHNKALEELSRAPF